jgi:hypothetical protein
MSERRPIMPEPQATHREINYKLCTALDMTGFGVTLDYMMASGTITKAQSQALKKQAEGLLAVCRLFNDQLLEAGGNP